MSSQNISAKNISEFVILGFETVEHKLAIGVVLLVVYIVVMLANTANIWFIAKDKHLHQPMYIFICNLALVDMMYSSSACPSMIGVLIAGYKAIYYIPCVLQMCAFNVGSVMEMFAIALMALDRLIAISNPLRYHSILNTTRTVVISVLLWLVAGAILTVIPATVLPLPFCSSNIQYIFCEYASLIRATCVNPNPYFNMISTLSFVLLFGTFSFICLSYIRIIMAVIRMTSKGDKKKMFHTCFSHLIVIVCFYAPMFIRIVLTRIGVILTLEERNGLMVGAILGPSLVNPFIYCFRTKEIRNKIFRIMSKIAPD
ncbi:olfactory receptor-like protein OLF3 [Myxocyprinus asiaticus]|uniref:olfactory receptor-like protein OLF3 n=1 Tax=Myxocyprinus asiaticus TaxID=70543 RepID=UPI0022238BDC|nr:olfactory receptor-like protein OLF3 [Myxocyprinus asiaticus]